MFLLVRMCPTGTYNIDMEVKTFDECVDYFNDLRHHKDKYTVPKLVKRTIQI